MALIAVYLRRERCVILLDNCIIIIQVLAVFSYVVAVVGVLRGSEGVEWVCLSCLVLYCIHACVYVYVYVEMLLE